MRKVNPFNNIGTAKVFLVIARGISRGADIAKCLNIQRAAVYEQTGRLEKDKLIERKPKKRKTPRGL